MQNAIAFCDNNVVVVAWSYGHKVEGCMGFAVYRVDPSGKEAALPSMAVFPGFTPKRGQTTASFPVQKFYWKDPYARLVADESGNRRFRYKIVPLAGEPGSLKPMTVAFLVSNEIEIGPTVAPKWRAFFNRGLISTQRVSTALGWRCGVAYSALIPACLTTPAQRAASRRISAAMSSGELGAISMPWAASAVRTSGSASAFVMSAWMRATTSRGVPAGASMPYQRSASTLG